MATLIDIELLPVRLRKLVREALPAIQKKERAKKMHPDYLMTYKECAELYGYTYGSLRVYVHEGVIRSIGKHKKRRISHAEMRRYINTKLPGGRPIASTTN